MPDSGGALSEKPSNEARRRRARWPVFLLLLPVLAVLWVPSYNSVEPQLAGIPFFYWYQLLWIVISAALTLLAYLTGE
jgi:uncharacterized RDD family membrane protein YckC